MIDRFKLEDYIVNSGKNPAIIIKTKEEAISLCIILHELGYKWASGDSYIDCTRYDLDCGTVYFPKTGTSCPEKYLPFRENNGTSIKMTKLADFNYFTTKGFVEFDF